jgi:hypothetical protein
VYIMVISGIVMFFVDVSLYVEETSRTTIIPPDYRKSLDYRMSLTNVFI